MGRTALRKKTSRSTSLSTSGKVPIWGMSLSSPKNTTVIVRIGGRHQYCWKENEGFMREVLLKDTDGEESTPLLKLNKKNWVSPREKHHVVQAKAGLFPRTTTTVVTRSNTTKTILFNRSQASSCDMEAQADRHCDLAGTSISASKLAETPCIDDHQIPLEDFITGAKLCADCIIINHIHSQKWET